MAQIVILAGAESHLLTLFARFEDQSEGLGFRFHGDCGRAFALLAQFPEIAPMYGVAFDDACFGNGRSVCFTP